ncbi:hypothetical protein Bbelb_022710 [Branchiostoma belcheri]|nr:hypothetical protein Bbelb_022710 [Branchiostoma belcheri]
MTTIKVYRSAVETAIVTGEWSPHSTDGEFCKLRFWAQLTESNYEHQPITALSLCGYKHLSSPPKCQTSKRKLLTDHDDYKGVQKRSRDGHRDGRVVSTANGRRILEAMVLGTTHSLLNLIMNTSQSQPSKL